MRAAVLHEIGAPLQVQEPALEAPRAGEAQVRVEAAGIGDEYPLEAVNEAYAALGRGAVGRAVILPGR